MESINLKLVDKGTIQDIAKTKVWKSMYGVIKKASENDDKNLINTIEGLAYDVLTQVPEMEDAFEKAYGKDLGASADYKRDNDAYKAVLKKIIQYVEQSSKWTTESTGAWTHFIRKGKKTGGSTTTKWYGTLKDRGVDSIKIVQNFIFEVSKIETEAEIQVKVPGNYGAFIKHADSIVIHFQDKNLKDKIEEIAKKFHVNFADRARLSRTDFGVDDKAFGDKGSDSAIIAKKFAQTIEKSRDSFTRFFKEKTEQEINAILLSVLNKIALNSSHRK